MKPNLFITSGWKIAQVRVIKIKNTGKVFEQSIQQCIPKYAFLYRLPDAAQAFGKSTALRFSIKNPFDYLLWDSMHHRLFALELKTVKSKSISFERGSGENGIIHHHQIVGLNKWNKYDGIICGFIIEFRESDTTIFLDISDFNKLLEIIDKKSFTLNDLSNNDIPYLVIFQKKKRTRFTYDIDAFLNDIEKIVILKEQKNTGGTQK